MDAFRTSTLPILCLLPLALGVLAGCDSGGSGMNGGGTPEQISSVELTDQADGDGTVLVGIGNDAQVSAEVNDTGSGIESVEADVSALDAGTVTLTDKDGDGTYEAAFTVGGTASEGDQTATVTVTSGNGDQATAETNALAVQTPPQISYDLAAQSNDGTAAPDGVSGTVTFWRAGPDSTLVTLDLDEEATVASVSHPAHIHNNSAEEGGDIEYYLSAVNGSGPTGTSARKIGVPIEDLARFNGYVNVHQSPANVGTVVAQTNIGANTEGTEGSGLDFVDSPDATTYSLEASTTEGTVFSDGIAGTVRFEELTGSQTLITYALDTGGSVNDANGGSVDVAQIGHIHENTVSEGGAIVSDPPFSGYLGSIDPTDPAARSSRIIEAGYDELTSYDGYVNLHQSNANAQYVFAQGNIGANAEGSDGGTSVDVTVTVNNVGTSAWEVTDVEGASGVAGSGENPTLTLEVGTRYRFDNNGGSAHPLGFQDGSSDYLLNQDGSGSLEGDSDIGYEEDGDGVTFTYTQSLADEVATYRCTVHPSMEGDVN